MFIGFVLFMLKIDIIMGRQLDRLMPFWQPANILHSVLIFILLWQISIVVVDGQYTAINWEPDISPEHIHPGHFPSRTIPPSFLHGAGHFPLPSSPSANLQYKACAKRVQN